MLRRAESKAPARAVGQHVATQNAAGERLTMTNNWVNQSTAAGMGH
jgi:hypothetical protein